MHGLPWQMSGDEVMQERRLYSLMVISYHASSAAATPLVI
jgi:hypothetical protein